MTDLKNIGRTGLVRGGARLLVAVVGVVALLLVPGACTAPQSPPNGQEQPANSPDVSQADEIAGWEAPAVNADTDPLPDFISVVKRVRPSVVTINTEVVAYNIFNQPRTQEGAGSGWIIDDQGLVVTNHHVIADAREITVNLSDGTSLDASVVGSDALTDMAVLKVGGNNLTAMEIGDSTGAQVGEWVLAVGNSLGRGTTAKEGIVSRLDVSVPVSETQTLQDLIEISAPINPGNSGGPLVNMAGQVIGITSLKVAAAGVEGMGYTIPTAQAVPIIEELVQQGYVSRPWLGVAATNMNQMLAEELDVPIEKGAVVARVASGSPAQKAGLERGDVIVKLADQEITGVEELRQAIHGSAIGEQIEVVYWRGDTERSAQVELAESPVPQEE
ncbi:MAG: S1C family serine protease [Chloroflexota bacterium]